MLTDYLTSDTQLFAHDVTGWREAIDLLTSPLIRSGAITTRYVDAITDSIAAGGVYIDLGFGIALAHSRPENGVVRTALSSLRVSPPVLLNSDPAHPIDLFFCPAATDPQGHLATMKDLAALLTNDELRTRLLDATTPAEASAVIQEIGTQE